MSGFAYSHPYHTPFAQVPPDKKLSEVVGAIEFIVPGVGNPIP